MSLAGIVQDAMHNDHGSETEQQDTHTTKLAVRQLRVPPLPGPKRRSSGYGSTPGSPAGRTGPPSSSFPISPSLSGSKSKSRSQTGDSVGNSVPPSRMNSQGEAINPHQSKSYDGEDADASDPYRKNFVRSRSGLYVTKAQSLL